MIQIQTQGRIVLTESTFRLRVGEQVFCVLWIESGSRAYIGSYAGTDADGHHTMILTSGEAVVFTAGHTPLVRAW